MPMSGSCRPASASRLERRGSLRWVRHNRDGLTAGYGLRFHIRRRRFFRSVVAIEALVFSPLKALSEGFASERVRQGYAPGTVHPQKKLLAGLRDWLVYQGLVAGDLTSGRVDRFFGDRRSAGIIRHKTRKALDPVPDCLRGLNVTPPSGVVVADGPASAVLDRYRRFLRVERSLVTGTGDRYVGCLRPFLDRRPSADGLGLELGNLTPADVTAFVVAWCPRLNSGVAKLTITAAPGQRRSMPRSTATACA